MKSGGMKETPLWYDVYRKYPPDLEPDAERPIPPQDPIPEIVYEDDYERVKNMKSTSKERKGKKRNISSKIPHIAKMAEMAAIETSDNPKEKPRIEE